MFRSGNIIIIVTLRCIHLYYHKFKFQNSQTTDGVNYNRYNMAHAEPDTSSMGLWITGAVMLWQPFHSKLTRACLYGPAPHIIQSTFEVVYSHGSNVSTERLETFWTALLGLGIIRLIYNPANSPPNAAPALHSATRGAYPLRRRHWAWRGSRRCRRRGGGCGEGWTLWAHTSAHLA